MYNIPQRIRSAISDSVNRDASDLQSADNIEDMLILDSLDMTEVLLALEEEFEVEILDIEFEEAQTFEEMVGLIERLTKGS